MADQYEDKVIHSYDGIEEYDNPLPGWWKGIFYATVVWAGVYVVGISLDYIPDRLDDLKTAQKAAEDQRNAYAASRPPLIVDATLLLAARTDDAQLTEGAGVYASNCASCHGDLGQGLIGPNLVDKYWLHGGEDVAIFKSISAGVPAKGMPPWESILTPEERVAVTAFIFSIRGTTPDNPKEPQGEEYVEAKAADAAPAPEGGAPEGDKAPEEGAPEGAKAPSDAPPADPGTVDAPTDAQPAEAPAPAPTEPPAGEK